jgi:enhancing lycopene biosynthesis protein 2
MAQADFIVKNGAVILNGQTATSTSTTTGALVIQGGIGLSGNSTFGGKLNITSATSSTNSTTGALTVLGGAGFYNDVNIGGTLKVQGVDLLKGDTHVFYVSEDGNDTNTGKLPQSAVRTIARGLVLAGAVGQNAVVFVLSGNYVEEFPLTVPIGVSVRGDGLREVYVSPTTATNTQSAFLLNGQTSISDFTVGGFYKPGYAFKFANSATIASRSPYVERFSVITRGSNPTAGDPYGFDSNDAGGGAYLDGSQVTADSLEAAFLFNEATFITPSSTAVHITNGTRVELLNGFSYFSDKGIVAESGSVGWGGQGRTRLRLANTTGTFTVGHNLYYIGSTGTVLASGAINEVTPEYVYLTGKASGFVEAADRSGKTVNVLGNAQVSSFQKKFGTASARFTTDGDLLEIGSDADLQYGFSTYTVEAWVHLTTGGRKQYVINKGNTAATTFGLYLETSNKLTGQHGTTVFTATTVLNTGTWYHVMMSRDSANQNRLFVNGVLEATTTATANITNSDNLTIGGYSGVSNLSLRGYLDEIRVSTVARYTDSFTVPTVSYNSDVSTTILIHSDGADGSVSITDDGLGSQNVYSTTASYTATVVASAQQITLADYRQFGGEMRSIGSAVCYGNYGIYADGEGIDLKAISFNMSYIGSGKDFTNDPNLAVQANEIVALNGAKVYYQTVDHLGDFRVGPEFRINQRTGNVDFGTANFNLGPLSSLTISDGVNSSVLTPTSIQIGQLLFSGSRIQTNSGNLTIDPAGTLVTVESDLQVNGALNFTGQLLATSVANSTSTTTGALVVSGGVGIAKNLVVGGDTYLQGDLYVDGNQFQLNSNNLNIGDKTISLSTGAFTASIAALSGLQIGPSATPHISWLYDGVNNWVSSNGIKSTNTLTVISSVNAINTSTGALQVAGGAGIGGDLYAQNAYDSTGKLISTGTIASFAVSNLTAGADINLTGSVGSITVSNTSTLQTVTARGSSTNVIVRFLNITNSVGTDSGAVTVAGGLGVAGDIYGAGIYSNGSPVVTVGTIGSLGVTAILAGTDTAVSTSTGVVTVWNTGTLETVTSRGSTTTSKISITNATSATSTTTGALTVEGGVGVGGAIYAGGLIYSNGVLVLTSEADTLQTVTGRGNTTNRTISITNTSSANSTNSGALIVSGGVGIGENLIVGGYTNIVGNATISGDATIEGGTLSLNAVSNEIISTTGDLSIITSIGKIGLRSVPGGLISLTATNIVLDGKTSILSSAISTSTTTGALTVNGGVGVNGDIYALNLFANGSQVLTNATLGAYGVISISTGSGISINTSTGAVTITSVDTLQLVTDRGNSTTNPVYITNATDSTGTFTGALVVSGGTNLQGRLTVAGNTTATNVEITNDLTVNGLTRLVNTTESTGTTTGALVVTGGVGIGGNLYASTIYGGTVYDNTKRVITEVTPVGGSGISITGLVSSGPTVGFNVNNTGVIALQGSTYIGVSSATGIVSLTNLGVQTLTAGTDTAVSSSTGTITIWNNSTLQSVTDRGNTTNRAISISNSTDANTSTAGALIVTGGVGIGRNLIVGANATIYGNLQVYGTSTYVNSTQTVIVDPVLSLGVGPNNTALGVNDGLDRGILLHYNTTATINTAYDNHSFIGMDNATQTFVYKTNIYPGPGQEFPALFSNTGTFGAAKFGSLQLTSTTSATSTTTGALVVAGGVGIGGSLYVNNTIYSGGLEVLTTSSLGSGGVGVSTISAGTDTAVSANFGAVTIWNTSTLQSVTDRGAATSNVITLTNTTPSSNTGSGALIVYGGIGALNIYASAIYDNGSRVVSSVTPSAGVGISISSLSSNGPGASFTVNNTGVTSLQGTTYIGVSASTGSVTLTNLGVQTLTAGTDTAVSSTTGTVTVWNNSTLQSVTDRGFTTTNRINITDSTDATTVDSAALTVAGGVGIADNILVGTGAITRSGALQNAFASGSFSVAGDAQAGIYVLRRSINSTTPTALTSNGSAASGSNQIVLPNDSTFAFKILVSARASASNDGGAWEFNGVITRNIGASSATVRIVNKTKIWSSVVGYDVNVVADQTNGALQILANSGDTSVIRFVAKVETTEVVV